MKFKEIVEEGIVYVVKIQCLCGKGCSDPSETWFIKDKNIESRKDRPSFKSCRSLFHEYYFNGELHREDGPASEILNSKTSNKISIWALNGRVVNTKEEFLKQLGSKAIVVNGAHYLIDGRIVELPPE